MGTMTWIDEAQDIDSWWAPVHISHLHISFLTLTCYTFIHDRKFKTLLCNSSIHSCSSMISITM